MLYRKFNLILDEIKNNNFKLAIKLLNEIRGEINTKAALAFYNELSNWVNASSKTEIKPNRGLMRLNEYDEREILPGISIVTCCMNRNENLHKALLTWLKLPVDEIIVVDWSSTPTVAETISNIQDDRIKILRVEGETKWILTYGFNVGLRFASYSKVFKFDADIQVKEDFLEKNSFKASQFIRGYWKDAIDRGDETQAYVNGSFGCEKASLINAGYYNELIRTYGWDDSDLYERLSSQCGLETRYLNYASLRHLEQEEEERTINQDVNRNYFVGTVKATDFNNYRNKYIGRTTDYWNISRLQNYAIEQEDNNSWLLTRITSDITVPQYVIEQGNYYASLHFLWNQQHQLITKSQSYYDFAQLIFNEYHEKIDFSRTLELLGENGSHPSILFFTSEYQNYEEVIDVAISKATQNQSSVFVIAIGEEYKHQTIFNFGNVVECILLSKSLLNVLETFWHLNNVQVNYKNSYPSLLSSIDFQNKVKIKCQPVVFVDAQHGLGNRIRAIGSAAAIAKSEGRELVIIWEPDHHCECRFSDLFEYSGKVIEKSFVDLAAKYIDVFNYMEIEVNAKKDKEVVLTSARDVYLRAAYTFKHSSSNWDSENEFIRTLKPTEEIISLVNQFNLENCIAAHVRMEAGKGLDHNTYDSIANWTQEGHDELHFWRDKSHFSNFINHIDKLLEEKPDLKIFLATDLKENYQIFDEYYGDKLVYLERDLFDRSAEQIKYALADAILLSKCSRLLGSTWSSFSELAMRLSDMYSTIEMSGKDF